MPVITEPEETTPQFEDEQEDFEMDYNFDDMFKFNELNTYFDIHVAGLDGECFEYNIYFEGAADESRVEEIFDHFCNGQSFVVTRYEDGNHLYSFNRTKIQNKSSVSSFFLVLHQKIKTWHSDCRTS